MKNLVLSLFLLAICNFIVNAQDLTVGLQVNDLSLKPMQPLSKPGYLQTVTDPSFGTTIRRISNAGAGDVIKPMYSTTQAWNADETRMILYQRGQGHILLDGITYVFIRNLDDINPDDIEQIFWDFNDPDIFYYLDKNSNEFIRYTVSTQSKSTIVDLDVAVTNCSGSFSMGNDVQMMSWDSDVFCFRCNNDRAYYYKISTANITEFNIDNIAYTAPMPAPSGNYFYHLGKVYNAQGNLSSTLNETKGNEHSCLGRLADGSDAHFAIAFAQGPSGGCIGDVVAHNLTNANCFTLTSEAQGYDYPQSGTHISALSHKNTQGGWVAASLMGYDEDGQSLLDQELIIARANQGNVQVCRIGHHRSDEDEAELGIAEGNNYFGEPHAVISPTGTRVLFGSDWSGSEDGQSIDAYVVELPAYDPSSPPPPPPPPPPPSSQNAVVPGNIQVDATFEHVGILYNIGNDENLNSNLQIEFREQGNSAFNNGAITMRSHPGLVIDGSSYNANHHAGSAMFLQPNTTYDIRLTLTDPDGGGTTTTISATTRAYPTESNNFRYVAPGNGGGNGTSANPYLGLQTAADNATPGTTFIVRPGNYTPFSIATDGTTNAPITFRSETTHAAIVDGGNTNSGVIVLGDFSVDSLQHIIIDGLKIQNGRYGIDAQHTQYLTIKNCWIENVTWGIYNRRENGWEHDQYITNNYIFGRTAWPSGGTEHRGIDIRGNRNVISFNTIKDFDDAVSTDGAPYGISYAMDIHNNDIQNMADDLIEVDGTVSNTRIYRNRMYNGRAGVSLAPVFGGPCYVFRNEMYNMRDGFSAYKMNRGPSGLVIVHNSSSKIENGMSSPVGWQNTFIKNNVIIGSRYCFEEFGLVNGSVDDWDYNAYHSTRPGVNTQGQEWFKWNNIRYGNITELQNEINIGNNGVAFSLSNDIEDAPPPTSYSTEFSSGDADFRPTSSSVFRNNGIQLDNLNDEYVTDGQPDRGAYEFGRPLPIFGASFDVQPPISQNEITPGSIKVDPTFEHIGILYNISGDANLNSNLQIEFREQGNGAYQNGAITMRSHPGLVIDGSTYNANHHAGSAMFLQPNTTYDIRLTLTDPDGGGTSTTITASTKAYPTETSNYRYVASGNGGGNGTSASPYLGLQVAADNAQAGITYLVRPGNYSGFNLTTSGTRNAPITFRSEEPREAIINGGSSSARIIELGVFNDSLQHIIIDGFTIENGNIAIDAQNTQYLTVKNCRIKDVDYGIYNRRENGWEHDQYITNNYLTGTRSWPGNGTTELRAVDIRGNRNVVSFNTIEYFDDAVSTDGRAYGTSFALDIHNNDIKSMVDDLIEVDFTVSNTRVYRNRGYNGRSGISLAPILGGPCYVFRNELFNMDISSYKMNRGTSGMVIVHNTASKAGNGMSSPVGWQNTFIKNNVLIGSRYCFEEYGTVSGSTDDWDYNAYHSTRAGTVGQEWFKWEDGRYANITALQNATSVETNGLEITLTKDMINGAPPSAYGTAFTPADRKFQPYNAANFRNNGIDLDNLNDPYVNDGQPDRGAYEYANTLPKFGVNFEMNISNASCTVDMAYSIDLSNNDIIIQYDNNQSSLTLTGIVNSFMIKVEDVNGTEISSRINTNNELVIDTCNLSSGLHYLVIQNNSSPNVYLKLLIL